MISLCHYYTECLVIIKTLENGLRELEEKFMILRMICLSEIHFLFLYLTLHIFIIFAVLKIGYWVLYHPKLDFSAGLLVRLGICLSQNIKQKFSMRVIG